MTLRPLSTVLALTSCVVTSSALADDRGRPHRSTGTIVVDVATFRNEKGALGCRLFASSEGFPRSTTAFAQLRTAITAQSGRCTFVHVPPGTYAVAVLHDENLNGKVDTNLFGAPTEGYGVSNNKTYALSDPKWDESKFVVGTGQEVHLTVSLRY